MNKTILFLAAILMIGIAYLSVSFHSAEANQHAEMSKAFINGMGDGWVTLTLDDFVHVNCDEDTWSTKDGLIQCTGTPVGVIRSKKIYTNFEIVIEWMHEKHAGNSGLFVWAPMHALENLKRNSLPGYGIEVQMLDHGYKENYEKDGTRVADWFSTNGDVFPVGKSTLTPFPPLSANGARSFPSKELSKGFGNWNHYYVRAINGELRLWVNGEEVSGGNNANPATGHICLESEGSPIKFKNIRIRELP